MSIFSKKCADICGKILQVLLIVSIALVIVSLFMSIGLETLNWIIILIIVYVLYLIAQFCSSTASLLCNKTNEMGIKIIMENLVRTHPEIQFYCECYHYETRTVRYNPPKKGGGKKIGGKKPGGGGGKNIGGNRVPASSGRPNIGGRGPATSGKSNIGSRGPVGGGTRVRTERKRITTWRETASFPYYSARDVSGLFQLNNSREAAMGKVYVKLVLTPEINFADELTYMDYEYFRNDFYNRNRPKDQYMDYRETRTVPGLNNFNLVCIRDQEPCGVNICMFILFTIIPLAELYKCYINSYCLDQSFKIRKLISTRYDLNQDQYQYFVPSFDVPNQQYAFDPNSYNYINTNYQVKQPTNEEISRAAMYKDKIPKYECVSYTSLNGNIKVGVVQDDPAYSSVNINEAPPPSCQDVGPQNGNDNMNMNMNMNMNNMNMNMNMNMNNMNVGPQNGNNNMNMNMNMNMNGYNNMNIDSNNNLNNNMYNNNNYNMNQGEDDYSEEEGQGYVPYSGGY